MEMMVSLNPDDQLTSLNWLVQPPAGGGILPLNPPTPPSTPPTAPLQQVQIPITRPREIDYRVENLKPPYSYAQLITMAMQAHGGEKVVLTDIYHWIRDNFCFFRGSDNSWQNSIRHNLSLNKQFIKVPRDPEDKGKGSYWMLDPKSFRKDPYCIRRRNFFDANSRKPRQTVDRPQVNPAVRSFLEKARMKQHSIKHPFAGTGERLEDIGAQECVYSDGSHTGYTDYNQKLFKKEVETYCAYVPQNDLVINTGDFTTPEVTLTGPEKVKVEYNWEGYEYHPSNVFGAQLPLQLSPGGVLLNQGGSVSLSPPNSDEAEGIQSGLDLRIPTPEWWNHHVTTASLLSPTTLPSYGSASNGAVRVFETLGPMGTGDDGHAEAPHPWQDRNPLDVAQEGLIDLDGYCTTIEMSGGSNSGPITTFADSGEEQIISVDS